MNTLFFDIKTAPLPGEELEKIKPRFSAPSNYRETDKIAAVVLEKETSWREQAALSALSGAVLAIGCLELSGKPQILDFDDETEILRTFWNLCREKILASDGLGIGFNIHAFDLPFLLRRSWRLGVAIPLGLRQGRYWNHRFIDLLDMWMLHDREHISLARLSAYFNIGEKLCDGADFARLWENDRSKARACIERDLELIHRLATAMGALPETSRPEQNLIDQLISTSSTIRPVPQPRSERPHKEKSRACLSHIAPLTHVTE